jgi:hypothetical protein
MSPWKLPPLLACQPPATNRLVAVAAAPSPAELFRTIIGSRTEAGATLAGVVVDVTAVVGVVDVVGVVVETGVLGGVLAVVALVLGAATDLLTDADGVELTAPALASLAACGPLGCLRAITRTTITGMAITRDAMPMIRSRVRCGGASGCAEWAMEQETRAWSTVRQTAQTSIPSRRADRWRCLPARSRRNRFTSMGSAANASGVSMRALRTW